MRQLLALALVRSGAVQRANDLLRALCQEGHTDGETLGILARTYKDLWLRTADSVARAAQLSRAHEIYDKAYRLAVELEQVEDAYYTGINAATTALLLGKKKHALSLSRAVSTLCRRLMQQSADRDDAYWVLATQGEAALILGEWSDAEDCYTRAGTLGQRRFADLSSTRNQARILMDHLTEDRSRFDGCFSIPKVVVFTGHMIDRPNRPSARFPPLLEETVRQQIRTQLDELDAGFGYASAARGADILFLEEMLARNGEIHVVPPFPREEFVQASVDLIPGANWKARFYRVLQQAAHVSVIGEQNASQNPAVYEYTNLVLNGLGSLRAQTLDTELIPLVVWDGSPGNWLGGTSSQVNHWQSKGIQPVKIETPAPNADFQNGADELAPPAASAEKTTGYPQQIMSMLFADVVGYSKLTEEEIPSFVQDFIGVIADLIQTSAHAPVVKNTWGDAFYFVFSSITHAGNFALEMCDLVHNTDWTKNTVCSLFIFCREQPLIVRRSPE